ncbi:MAG: DNA polymerase III subunit delta [Myxococcales bacterium]|nr:DNA polymerase III subunit delta [Myxococcales bacterium]
MSDPVKDLRQAIARGRLALVYVLYGDEPAAIKEVVQAIREAIIPADDLTAQSMAAFNHERFDGGDVRSASQVLEACAQVPMLARYRLVELANPDDLGKGGRGDEGGPTSTRDAALDALAAYVKEPSPSTVLVISGAGIDGRSKLVNAAKKSKSAVVQKFEAFKRDDDARRMVIDEARERGRTLDADAAFSLVSSVGTGRTELLEGLDRVLLYAGERTMIGVADVEAVIAQTREVDVFALTDAVGRGDHHEALVLLAQIFASGEKETGLAHRLFALLTRQIRMIMTAKAHAGKFGAVADVPPFLVRKYEEQARGFSMERLRLAYAGLARLDFDLKGGSHIAYASPFLALQRWILEACDALPGVEPRR